MFLSKRNLGLCLDYLTQVQPVTKDFPNLSPSKSTALIGNENPLTSHTPTRLIQNSPNPKETEKDTESGVDQTGKSSNKRFPYKFFSIGNIVLSVFQFA